MNGMKEKPTGIALCICEAVITEAITNKRTLVGMFNSFGSVSFPAVMPKLCVFVSVTGGKGAVQSVVRCVHEESGDKVFEVHGTINFQDPNQVAEANFEFHNLPFLKPGLHCVELLCEDELILQRRMQVVQIRQIAK